MRVIDLRRRVVERVYDVAAGGDEDGHRERPELLQSPAGGPCVPSGGP